MYHIYDWDYTRYGGSQEGGYKTVGAACDAVLSVSNDFIFMVGTDKEISAFVYQGRVYRTPFPPPPGKLDD